MNNTESKLVMRTELAHALGRSASSVGVWVKQGCPHIMRPLKKGGKKLVAWFNVDDVIAWHVKKFTDRKIGYDE